MVIESGLNSVLPIMGVIQALIGLFLALLAVLIIELVLRVLPVLMTKVDEASDKEVNAYHRPSQH